MTRADFFSFAEAGRHIWPGSKTVYRQQLSCKRFKLTDYTFQRGPRPKSFLYPPFYGTSKWLKHLGSCTGQLSFQYGLKSYPKVIILTATPHFHHFQGALLLPLLFIQHFPKPFLSRRGCKKSECHGPLHEK